MKTENIIIRNVEEKDIPSVVDIQINGWRTAYKGIVDDEYLDSMNREERIETRKKDYKNSGFIVAELNNEVVGFTRYVYDNSFSPDKEDVDCELMAIYVRPDLKRNGIGRKLFKYVLDEFKDKNKTKMILWCLKDNEPSKAFYKKMGGIETYEKPADIGGKVYYEVGFLYDV